MDLQKKDELRKYANLITDYVVKEAKKLNESHNMQHDCETCIDLETCKCEDQIDEHVFDGENIKPSVIKKLHQVIEQLEQLDLNQRENKRLIQKILSDI